LNQWSVNSRYKDKKKSLKEIRSYWIISNNKSYIQQVPKLIRMIIQYMVNVIKHWWMRMKRMIWKISVLHIGKDNEDLVWPWINRLRDHVPLPLISWRILALKHQMITKLHKKHVLKEFKPPLPIKKQLLYKTKLIKL